MNAKSAVLRGGPALLPGLNSRSAPVGRAKCATDSGTAALICGMANGRDTGGEQSCSMLVDRKPQNAAEVDVLKPHGGNVTEYLAVDLAALAPPTFEGRL